MKDGVCLCVLFPCIIKNVTTEINTSVFKRTCTAIQWWCEVRQLWEDLNQALQGLLNEFYIYMSSLNVSVWCQALSNPICGWCRRFRVRWLGHEPGRTSLSEPEQGAGQCKDAVYEECGDGWRGGGGIVLDFLMWAHLTWMKTCRNPQITFIVI